MSIVQGLLLGLLGGFGIWDSRVLGLMMLDRPLVLGTLTGLILGDLQTGVITGAAIELVMMGVVTIGSATPSDTVSGSILATAFAITAGLDISASIALALPIATLGQLVGIAVRTFNVYFLGVADKHAEAGNYKGVENALWSGAWLFFASYFVLIFAGAMIGSVVINEIVQMIPASVINGFKVASGMLPALGIAILMQMLFNKKNAAFFFVGWALTAIIGVNTIGTAVVGTTIAYIIFQYSIQSKENNNMVEEIEGEL